jgi:hypothetical protein
LRPEFPRKAEAPEQKIKKMIRCAKRRRQSGKMGEIDVDFQNREK